MTTINRPGVLPTTLPTNRESLSAPVYTATPIFARPGGTMYPTPIIERPVPFPEPPIFQPPRPFPLPFPEPGPIPLPPVWNPRPQQTDLELVKARFEAMANPGLQSDTNYLEAAKRDLAAYERFEPNSPRVAELKQLVGQLSQKVTHEATQAVDQALNQWFQSDGGFMANFQLLETLNQASAALQQSAPYGSEAQFVDALKSYVQSEVMPPRPPIFY